MLITANNPSLEVAERTWLTDPVIVGATTSEVKSTENFSATTYVCYGEPGTENAEIVLLSTITDDNTLAHAALKFDHPAGEPIYYMRYNQVRFYMASSLTGTYSVQTTVDIDVDSPDNITTWDDTDGVSTNYYKISYYNEQTTLESSLSGAIPGSGIAKNTVRYITDEILKEANDEQERVTSRDEIRSWMNDCQDDVRTRRRRWWFWKERAAATRTADQEYYSVADNFGVSDLDLIALLEHNLITDTSNNTYPMRYVSYEEFQYKTDDNNATTDDNTQVYTWDEAMDYIRVYPTPNSTQTAAYYLHYYKLPTELDSDDDVVEIPDTRIYKYYCLQMFHLKKPNPDITLSDRYGAKYEQAIRNLARKNRRVLYPAGFTWNPNGIRHYFKY